MIKFFRRIRQKLMAENKAGRYFLYALGEIALVMIGILLAVQINNMNQERVNKKKEANYIIKLKQDLENQLEIIDRCLNGEQLMYDALSKAAQNYERNNGFTAEQKELELISAINGRYTFTIVSPTFTDLLSTGNLDLLSDQEIREAIVRYYEDLELSRQIIQKNNDSNDIVLIQRSLNLIYLVGDQDYGDSGDLTSTFANYQIPERTLQIIRELIKVPQNELALINMIKFRRLQAQSHTIKLENAEKLTKDLIARLIIQE